MKQHYKVNALFQTIQGKGFYTGLSAIFYVLGEASQPDC